MPRLLRGDGRTAACLEDKTGHSNPIGERPPSSRRRFKPASSTLSSCTRRTGFASLRRARSTSSLASWLAIRQRSAGAHPRRLTPRSSRRGKRANGSANVLEGASECLQTVNRVGAVEGERRVFWRSFHSSSRPDCRCAITRRPQECDHLAKARKRRWGGNLRDDSADHRSEPPRVGEAADHEFASVSAASSTTSCPLRAPRTGAPRARSLR